MGEEFLYLLLNIFRLYVIYSFTGVFFGKKGEKSCTPYLYTAYFLINILIHFMWNDKGVALILDRACLFSIIAAGYRGQKQKKMLAAILNIGVEAAAENFAGILFISGKGIRPEIRSISFFLFLYLLFEQYLVQHKKTEEKEIYRRQMQMYQRQLNVMQNTNDTYRTMRHDMKHHMNMISDYIDRGEYEKALEYLKKMNQYAGTDRKYIETGNECIDCVMNYAIPEIKKIGAAITIDTRAVQGIKVDDFDINMILSNLLRNSYEAMKKSREKELAILIQYDRGMINIRIKNTYNGNLNEKEGRFLTTKEDAASHGIGLISVRKVVEKYNENMEIQHTEEEFQVNILLYALPQDKKQSLKF